MSVQYGKLVRDKIPQIIEERGERPIVRKLDGNELEFRLKLKLKEELEELVTASEKSDIVAEIADLLEVIDAYRKLNGITKAHVENVKKTKAERRGKFKEGYYLVSVEEPLTEEEIEERRKCEELTKMMRRARHKGTKITVEMQ